MPNFPSGDAHLVSFAETRMSSLPSIGGVDLGIKEHLSTAALSRPGTETVPLRLQHRLRNSPNAKAVRLQRIFEFYLPEWST